jgi:hypothetical protein
VAAKFEERLDRMVEVAREAERPYKALEGKPFNLSASVARTIVVGSGLSKSSDEVRDREVKRIAKWREQGRFGPAKAKAMLKIEKVAKSEPIAQVAEPEPKADEPDTVIKVDEPQAVEVPEAAAAGVDAAYAEAEKHRRAPRKRAPRKTGEASDTAKAIAANRITAPSA